jgi:hypothetical protein
MAFNFRYAFVSETLPKDLSGLLVERVNLPGVFRVVLDGSNVAVESVASFILRTARYGGCDEDLVAPDNWT